ncbi:hypothetical protein SALBM135S_07845 [Streptomyces alboniger]
MLPFDGYELSDREVHMVETAEDLLVRDCMTEQGMRWKLLPVPRPGSLAPENRRRYGVIEPEIARVFGYHMPPDSPEVVRRQEAWKEREKLPMREQLASFGKNGTGGCWGRAHARLRQDVPEIGSPTLNEIRSEQWDEVWRHPDVKAVIRAWRDCMSKNRYSYRDPLGVTEDEKWAETKRPTRAELTVAKLDVRCKERTGVVGVWKGVERDLQRQTIREHAGQFKKMRVAKERRLTAARRVLEKHGTVTGPERTGNGDGDTAR